MAIPFDDLPASRLGLYRARRAGSTGMLPRAAIPHMTNALRQSHVPEAVGLLKHALGCARVDHAAEPFGQVSLMTLRPCAFHAKPVPAEVIELAMAMVDRIARSCPSADAHHHLHRSAELLGALSVEERDVRQNGLPTARGLAERLWRDSRHCPTRHLCRVDDMSCRLIYLLSEQGDSAPAAHAPYRTT